MSRIPAKGETRVVLGECPTSYVSGESLAWIEDFGAWRLLGAGGDVAGWPARRAEAFLILEAERRKSEWSRDGE